MTKELNNLQHIWSVLCMNSVIDQETNNISLNNILEEIQIKKNIINLVSTSNKNSEKKEAILINFELVSFWKKLISKEEKIHFETMIKILDPEGEVLHTIPQTIEMKENIERFRSRIKFNAMPFTKPGGYIFQINVKKEKEFIEIGRIPLQIKIVVDKK